MYHYAASGLTSSIRPYYGGDNGHDAQVTVKVVLSLRSILRVTNKHIEHNISEEERERLDQFHREKQMVHDEACS